MIAYFLVMNSKKCNTGLIVDTFPLQAPLIPYTRTFKVILEQRDHKTGVITPQNRNTSLS